MTWVLPLILILLALGCGESISPGPANRRETERARQPGRRLAQAFQSRLRGELIRALEAGGPSAARQICAAAPATAREIGRDARPRAVIRRVTRTPLGLEGAPDPFERLALEHFEQERGLRGRLPEEWVQRLERAGERRLRYYQPLAAATPCLGCHGGAPGALLGLLSVEFSARDLMD